MQTSLPVALSAQLAMEKRLDTIADNLANSRTAGFRSTEVKFESFISRAAEEPVAFASTGETYISTRKGEMTQTGNSLDMAINGEAYFAVQGPKGPIYTKDGRMTVLDTGDVVSLTGNPFLDVGGAPIQIDPSAGPIQIARDGMVSQAGRQIGAVGLFEMPAGAKLSRAGNSGVVPDRPATPLLDFDTNSVLQGFTEGSNVNPILEMTRLIAVQRAFESASNFVETSEKSLDSAINTLGSRS
ncbi:MULTISPECIES: flagellar basal-body rod protein FlgF [unclassified Aureimonas]|uniref:flagellar basal-body rod protein FlgF n=1 Tax=unclassified Aureimonas TaxID=2615206 RepID=UPI0006FFF0A5|nr:MULTISPECIES: flagellar basal-body rod protein FlgF [unclassified Aureimonas]KQT66267.1 flagellar biosynthesis protein FlgF [Aureimonas sp. Leaf427]KQT72455.1 flagellar biosynthesis protein FlgF [Aureimonas sp. Leaf460]